MISDPTLLVVDDEQVYCDGCERIFSRQGFRVEGSNDATEALSLATNNDYSAIILDVKMPNMDGIRFLEHLRAAKPDTPVILMTGYPSIQNAASAIRLGASDYVTKPFTPEQITSAVRGLVRMDSSADKATVVEDKPSEIAADAKPECLLFHGRAWARLGDRTAVRVGGIIPRPEGTRVELQLPRVGDIVHQGLPLFAVRGSDGAVTTVPAPVTGMVLDVNSDLETNPEVLWEHPSGLGWVAKIAPTRLEREEARLQVRDVTAATLNQDFLAFYRDRLSRIGCTVHEADPTDADFLSAVAGVTGVVLLDAASCGAHGPETVGRLLKDHPETKIVVVAPTGAPQQDDYRAHRLFYYAVPPLEDSEILDIVDSCYRTPTSRSSASPAPSSQNLPISALHVDTDRKQRVTLLASGDLLQREVGLGLALRSKLLERLLPLETGLGDLKLTGTRVLREAARSDRVIVLLTAETSRIAGTLVPHRQGNLSEFVGVDAANVTVLAIQAMAGDPGMPKLDAATINALAEHVVEEMLV
jgi:DNA-binding response OmpR family regulator